MFNARLFGTTNNREVELFLLEQQNTTTWSALLRPAKKIHEGATITLKHTDITATVTHKQESGIQTIEFQAPQEQIIDYIETHGEVPLPPYITTTTPTTADDYQTVYAKEQGSVAAPTAGLHFTPKLNTQLHSNGIDIIDITLHVGIGTFRPIKTTTIEDHTMHSERYSIAQQNWNTITAAKREGRRIIAVGTTSARLLESLARTPPQFTNSTTVATGSTDIYITPGFEWKMVDALITNFHLPQSSLVVLVASLLGKERTMTAYTTAMQNGYRFYSYGDAMFIQ